jgi:hypothetical protein
VEQEVYAHLLVHDAIRALMHQAALDAQTDPDRLSVVRSLRIGVASSSARRPFPPDQLAHAVRLAIGEILAERLPVRRLRAFPRVVKRKMSNYHLKRAHHRTWPQPTRAHHDAVVLLRRTG